MYLLGRFWPPVCAEVCDVGADAIADGRPMKFVTARPFADPDLAARKLVEIANASEAVQDGRI